MLAAALAAAASCSCSGPAGRHRMRLVTGVMGRLSSGALTLGAAWTAVPGEPAARDRPGQEGSDPAAGPGVQDAGRLRALLLAGQVPGSRGFLVWSHTGDRQNPADVTPRSRSP